MYPSFLTSGLKICKPPKINDDGFGTVYGIMLGLTGDGFSNSELNISFLKSTISKKFSYNIAAGVETLNPKTLRDMKKGIDPLNSLFTIKTFRDISLDLVFNYFILFQLNVLWIMRSSLFGRLLNVMNTLFTII